MSAQLTRLAHPNAVVKVKTEGQIIDSDMVNSVSIYVYMFFIVTFIMALVYSMFGFDAISSMSASVSMMSNVGPCFGNIGSSMSNFADAPAMAKFIMGLHMIVGRLGLYCVIIIFFIYRKRA